MCIRDRVFVAVLLLMLVNSFTQTKILAEREAKVTTVLQGIYPEMQDFELKDDIYIILKGGDVIGYSFAAVGKGYGGDINTLVGLNKDYTCLLYTSFVQLCFQSCLKII